MQLTIVIPTYNEAENLPKLIHALFSQPLENLKVLVVDDNSPDGTGNIADDLVDEFPGRITVLKRPAKLGLGTAYICGFKLALEHGAEAIGQMDADFSHPPSKVKELLHAIATCDLALGSRYVPGGSLDKDWPLWRKSLSSFGNFYARTILSLPVKDTTGGFRIWRRASLSAMPLDRVRSNGYAFQIEMLYIAYRLGYSFQEVPFYFAERDWGMSKMSLKIQIEATRRVWELLIDYRDLRAIK